MGEIKKYTVTEPYLDIKCALGEGPFWEKDRNSLRFVDIKDKKLHTVDLSSGPSSHKVIDLDFSIAHTADIEGNDEEIIFGGKLGYGILNRESGKSRCEYSLNSTTGRDLGLIVTRDQNDVE